MDYSFVISGVAILLSFVGYYLYVRSALAGKTKPHVFSWFVWGILIAIAFAAQLIQGAGLGAWVTGTTMLACFLFALLGLKYGKLHFPLIDWICLAGAIIAIGLWAYFNDPTYSIILITLVDLLAWIPTVRKAYKKPQEENYKLFAIGSLKFFISLFALSTFTISTSLYPLYLTITNGLFAAMVVIRRKQLKKSLSD